jgi:hypothetical protein
MFGLLDDRGCDSQVFIRIIVVDDSRSVDGALGRRRVRPEVKSCRAFANVVLYVQAQSLYFPDSFLYANCRSDGLCFYCAIVYDLKLNRDRLACAGSPGNGNRLHRRLQLAPINHLTLS